MPQDERGRQYVWRRSPRTGARYRLFLAGLDTVSPWPNDEPAEVIRVELDDDDAPGETVQ